MALTLVLIVVFIVVLIGEKSRIQAALDLSQSNRDLILRTEGVTESLLVVDAAFKEYCVTFEKLVFEEYQNQVKTLAQNIELLIKSLDSGQQGKEQIEKTFAHKTQEADVYMKLKLITDSLIFSAASLNEKKSELESYIGEDVNISVDTLSVTETKETYKKGLLGKLKSAIVGEKIQQNVNTKLKIQAGNEIDRNNIRQAMIKALRANKVSANSSNFDELVKKSVELKESELNLIAINNSLIEQIQSLIQDVKNNIREMEAEHNNLFLKSVRNSTSFLQTILIVLMILAFALAVYILTLAHRNEKFQNNIIALNEKITKDSVAKDKFYSIVSHDIMNPFNALLGFSNMLKEAVKEHDQNEIEECSSIVHESANRISNLLQNLLVWSRVQNGKMPFAPKKCNISQIVTETLAIVGPIAKNKNIRLEWDPKEELQAEVDKNMIGSVLQNLITNAIKFSRKGGEVKVLAFAEAEKLNVWVSDNGVGMTDEQLHKLFRLDKTTSTQGTDEETGTGLGLIIAKEFVEKHGGKIDVESKVGSGTKFCFTIPILA